MVLSSDKGKQQRNEQSFFDLLENLLKFTTYLELRIRETMGGQSHINSFSTFKRQEK